MNKRVGNFDADAHLKSDPEYRGYIFEQALQSESPGSTAIAGVQFAVFTLNALKPKFQLDRGVPHGGSVPGGSLEEPHEKESPLTTPQVISRTEYSMLRRKTPSDEIRKKVNPEGPKVDPVYGYPVDKLEADHIVPMKEITKLPGFAELPESEQIKVLNLVDNFLGLGKPTNASKGAKTWSEWQGHSKLGPIPDNIREEMLIAERIAREAILEAIRKGLGKR